MATNRPDKLDPDEFHERRRLRARRNRRRAYIRSIYLLPSMATLGNAVCGFAAIYIAGLDMRPADPLTQWLSGYNAQTQVTGTDYSRFVIAAYFLFAAMFFDAIDGRLARFTRHTTDFGGQLDSLADAISFGVAPAILMLQLMREGAGTVPFGLTRTIWAVGLVYMCCAVIRLARFNVSNEHGEQHHFSFLGLPSPAAAAVVAAIVLLHQTLYVDYVKLNTAWCSQQVITDIAHAPAPPLYLTVLYWVTVVGYWLIPLLTLAAGLLMVSTIRYPHMVNRYLRGKRSMGRLVIVLIVILAILILHRYLLAPAILFYVAQGLWSHLRARRSGLRPEQATPTPPPTLP